MEMTAYKDVFVELPKFRSQKWRRLQEPMDRQGAEIFACWFLWVEEGRKARV